VKLGVKLGVKFSVNFTVNNKKIKNVPRIKKLLYLQHALTN